MATILKGALAAYQGIQIVNSEHMRENLHASGVYDGVTTNRAGILLVNLRRWLESDEFAPYHPQIRAIEARGRWDLLLDSFYQVLPFGTGGRRGPVGVGPNRYNPWTDEGMFKVRFPGQPAYVTPPIAPAPQVIVSQVRRAGSTTGSAMEILRVSGRAYASNR